MTVLSQGLRPLGMGQLLDLAIRLYRRNFLTFIGIVAMVQIPLAVLQLGASVLTFGSLGGEAFFEPNVSPDVMVGPALGVLGSLFVSVFGGIVTYILANAALTQAVAHSYLSGQKMGILDAYRSIGKIWQGLLGALLLAIALGIGLIIWTIVPCIGWLSGPGMLIFLGFIIIPLLVPVIVLEQQKSTDALRRAWDLVRRRFWWVLGFGLLLALFAQLIITGPVYLVTFLAQILFGYDPFLPAATDLVIQTVVQSVVTLIGTLIYSPLQLTAMTLLYFDLRIRTEGLDLALQTTEDDSDVMAEAPTPEAGNWITWSEIGKFVAIQLVAAGIYIALVGLIVVVAIAAVAATEGF